MKTTKKHFTYFVSECKKRVNDFGLFGWDITYSHEDGMRVLAECRTRIPQGSATIALSTNWEHCTSISREDLRITAAHEVAHLLVARLHLLGASRYVGDSELSEADEQIANSIVHLLRKYKIIS